MSFSLLRAEATSNSRQPVEKNTAVITNIFFYYLDEDFEPIKSRQRVSQYRSLQSLSPQDLFLLAWSLLLLRPQLFEQGFWHEWALRATPPQDAPEAILKQLHQCKTWATLAAADARGASVPIPRAPEQVRNSGLKDTVPERPYHSNLCTSEFH